MSTLADSLIAGLAAALSSAAVLLIGRWRQERRMRSHVLTHLEGLSRAVGPAATAELLRPNARGGGLFAGVMRRAPLLRNTEQLLEQADLAWSGRRLARTTGISSLALAVWALLITGSAGGTLTGAVMGGFLPFLYVLRRRARRLRIMERQLPEVIEQLTRALRAGHAVHTALRMVADEGPAPLAAEFRRVFEEQKYGLPFDESLFAMARRVELVDVRVMVVAILVQREVGGNLAEILENSSQLIRSRFTLKRQIRVYAAQGRMSGYVMGALPIAVGALIYLLNPPYVGVLFSDPAGRTMLWGAVGLQIMGYLWIWRLLKIDI